MLIHYEMISVSLALLLSMTWDMCCHRAKVMSTWLFAKHCGIACKNVLPRLPSLSLFLSSSSGSTLLPSSSSSFLPLLLWLCVLLESPTKQKALSRLQELKVNSGQETARNFSGATEGTELCQLPRVILNVESSLTEPQMIMKSTSALVCTLVGSLLGTSWAS